LFVDHPVIGLAYLGATFWFPNVGLAGLIGAVTGMSIGLALRLPHAMSGVNVYSSLLVGLSLGAYYVLSLRLALLIVLSAALTVLLAVVLRDVLWRLGRLPALSLPFVVVALTTALAAGTYGGLTPYYPPSQLPPPLILDWLDSFFASLGSTFFTPHPLVGALLFAGILLRSRYLAFLCLAGFASGQLVFTILAAAPVPGLLEWTGFNFALTAMALGGIFTVPSVATFIFALSGAAASAVVTGALSQLLLIYSLPVMALPFLLTTLTLLAALRLRVSLSPPTLLLERPGLPEQNFERARLGRARLGELDSVPLLPPFLGEWQIYQGFDGEHTHRDQWRYALDFHRVEDGQSALGDGSALEQYRCFGLPVLSPAYGLVVSVEDALPDNVPGDLDLRNNWGNHVLILIDSGLYVLLAHLKQFSVNVKEGERVTPGTSVGRCGSSGRSPQPHLHLQVQHSARLGGPTVPFHLVSSIVRPQGMQPAFRLVARLTEGDSVQRAEENRRLSSCLHLPLGRTLKYRVTEDDGSSRERTLRVEASLAGEFRLVAETGASAAFEQVNGTLGFYDRAGPADAFLDLWLLALGLTPLSTLARVWHDAPPARLFPFSLWARLALNLIHPLGAGLSSRYERAWSDAAGAWTQRGVHDCASWPIADSAQTWAVLTAERCCMEVGMEHARGSVRAQLLAIGQIADRGIPAWEDALPIAEPVSGIGEDK
jgi:urea transporter